MKPTIHTWRFWRWEDLKPWLEAERPGAFRIVQDAINDQRGDDLVTISVKDLRNDIQEFPLTYANAGQSVEDLEWLAGEFGVKTDDPGAQIMVWVDS